MKKVISVLAAVMIVLSFAACDKTLKGTDALIETAREHIPVADAENIDIKYAGLCARDDSALIWLVSGNEYQAHYYLPMECTVVGDNEYTFERVCKPLERGQDIAVLMWKGGYAFVINNPKCKSVRITDNSGTHEQKIEKDAYPYVFYNSLIPSEYEFLDENGNVL